MLIVFVVVISIVFVVGEKSFLDEVLISGVLFAGALFAVLTLGLFFGVHLKPDIAAPKKIGEYLDVGRVGEAAIVPDIGIFNLDGGLVGCLVGILIWLLAAVVIGSLVFLFANTFAFLIALVFWIFYNAFRKVYQHSGRCHGKLWESIRVGLSYTLLYTGWLVLVVYLFKEALET